MKTGGMIKSQPLSAREGGGGLEFRGRGEKATVNLVDGCGEV